MRYPILSAAVALCLLPTVSWALDIGFEGQVSVDISDNVEAANKGEEEQGQMGYGQFGVFASQNGRVVRGGFAGEFFTQRQLDDPDDAFRGVTQFLGAAEIAITPRSLTWFVGDILGGIRVDNAEQPIDGLADTRRNVFVTGPQFDHDINSLNRVKARALYINQSQNDEPLGDLYNISASWEFDTQTSNTFGLQLGDIYTDNPDDAVEGDFNRLSLSTFWRRDRGYFSVEGTLGATRYNTDDQALDGVNARLSVRRGLSAVSSLSFELGRDLQDQTLSTIETLIEGGVGIQPTGNGFFDETQAQLKYSFNAGESSFITSVGAVKADYQLLTDANGLTTNASSEDNLRLFVSSSFEHKYTPRLRILSFVNYETTTYDNRQGDTDSILAAVDGLFRLNTSFELNLGYRISQTTGSRLATQQLTEDTLYEDVDMLENRVVIGIKWAPPTRATKDLTVELKSLMQ